MRNTTPTPAWAPIPGFPLYEVSPDGRVRNASRGTLRKIHSDADGYQRVCLNRDGRGFQRYVHRLVLEAFVGPCPQGMEGCHQDGNKRNNVITNLRWDTHEANIIDLVRSGILRTAVNPRIGKTHCPFGHELGGANARPKSRSCLACNRGRAYARSRGIEYNKTIGDRYYFAALDEKTSRRSA